MEEVVIGNFFSIQMLSLPLNVPFNQKLRVLHEKLLAIKRSSEIYSMYLISLICGTIFPYQLAYWVFNFVTLGVTFQFSNVPGPRKPLVY